MDRLKDIKESGQSLRDNVEAQRILSEIRAEAQQPAGSWSFAARSLFSTDAVYIVAREKATSMFGDFLGKWLAGKLNLGTHARVLWQNDTGRRILRKIIVRHWNTMQTRGQLAKQWTKALTDEAVKLALGLLYDKTLEEQYDALYRRILGDHPSTVHATTHRAVPTPLEIRAVMAVAPAAMMPVMAAPAPIRAFAVPVAVQTYADPVASTAKTENQFIQSQQYTVSTSQPNTQSQGSDRSPSPEPRQSHPAPRMPSIGSSFGGGRGETLWSR
jgi:hypothetical protein